MLVLPTPPLPPVTAITCTGSPSPRSLALESFSAERMGELSEAPLEQFLVSRRTRIARELHGARDELERAGGPQVFRHPLSLAHIRDRQPGAYQHRKHPAEAR